ncbi:hypothetical protein ES703_09242 [subsurface metagenome]
MYGIDKLNAMEREAATLILNYPTQAAIFRLPNPPRIEFGEPPVLLVDKKALGHVMADLPSLLNNPRLSTIGGMNDRAAVTNRPTHGCIDEHNIIEVIFCVRCLLLPGLAAVTGMLNQSANVSFPGRDPCIQF